MLATFFIIELAFIFSFVGINLGNGLFKVRYISIMLISVWLNVAYFFIDNFQFFF